MIEFSAIIIKTFPSITKLEFWSNWSAILTAFVAVLGYGKYLFDQRTKRKTLEKYLKNEKLDSTKTSNGDKGQRSILRLIASLGMTEAEILHASFQSKHIKRLVTADANTGLATDLLLQYYDVSAKSYPKLWREHMKKIENLKA